jgi:DNA-binding transcriptional ArsR family regulator
LTSDSSRARPARAPAVDEKTLERVGAAAEPTRLSILFLLGVRGRMCVGDIAARFKASRPAISHHLKVLKSADLVETEREGQEIYYSVRMDRIVDTLRALADSLDRCCGTGGDR